MTVEVSSIEDSAGDFDPDILRRVDLNLLLVFALVYRYGSVRAAAGRLYLGASGVSMALGRLRDLTGDALFVRGRRGLEPTGYATALFGNLVPALAAIGSALSPTAFDPGSATGSVRLAMSEDVEIVLAPRLRAELSKLAPGLSLTIRNADYRRVAGLLDDGAAEAIITARPATLDGRHRCDILAEEDFVVLGGGGKRAPQTMSLKRYLATPHALVSASGQSLGRMDQWLAQSGHGRTVQVVTESFATLPFLLRTSALLANVPRSAGVALAGAFGLRQYELPMAGPTFSVAMTWHSRDDASAARAWVRELVRSEYRKACKRP